MPQNTNEYGPGNQAKLKKISGRPTKMGNPMANTLMGDPNPMGDMGDMGGMTGMNAAPQQMSSPSMGGGYNQQQQDRLAINGEQPSGFQGKLNPGVLEGPSTVGGGIADFSMRSAQPTGAAGNQAQGLPYTTDPSTGPNIRYWDDPQARVDDIVDPDRGFISTPTGSGLAGTDTYGGMDYSRMGGGQSPQVAGWDDPAMGGMPMDDPMMNDPMMGQPDMGGMPMNDPMMDGMPMGQALTGGDALSNALYGGPQSDFTEAQVAGPETDSSPTTSQFNEEVAPSVSGSPAISTPQSGFEQDDLGRWEATPRGIQQSEEDANAMVDEMAEKGFVYNEETKKFDQSGVAPTVSMPPAGVKNWKGDDTPFEPVLRDDRFISKSDTERPATPPGFDPVNNRVMDDDGGNLAPSRRKPYMPPNQGPAGDTPEPADKKPPHKTGEFPQVGNMDSDLVEKYYNEQGKMPVPFDDTPGGPQASSPVKPKFEPSWEGWGSVGPDRKEEYHKQYGKARIDKYVKENNGNSPPFDEWDKEGQDKPALEEFKDKVDAGEVSDEPNKQWEELSQYDKDSYNKMYGEAELKEYIEEYGQIPPRTGGQPNADGKFDLRPPQTRPNFSQEETSKGGEGNVPRPGDRNSKKVTANNGEEGWKLSNRGQPGIGNYGDFVDEDGEIVSFEEPEREVFNGDPNARPWDGRVQLPQEAIGTASSESRSVAQEADLGTEDKFSEVGDAAYGEGDQDDALYITEPEGAGLTWENPSDEEKKATADYFKQMEQEMLGSDSPEDINNPANWLAAGDGQYVYVGAERGKTNTNPPADTEDWAQTRAAAASRSASAGGELPERGQDQLVGEEERRHLDGGTNLTTPAVSRPVSASSYSDDGPDSGERRKVDRMDRDDYDLSSGIDNVPLDLLQNEYGDIDGINAGMLELNPGGSDMESITARDVSNSQTQQMVNDRVAGEWAKAHQAGLSTVGSEGLRRQGMDSDPYSEQKIGVIANAMLGGKRAQKEIPLAAEMSHQNKMKGMLAQSNADAIRLARMLAGDQYSYNNDLTQEELNNQKIINAYGDGIANWR